MKRTVQVALAAFAALCVPLPAQSADLVRAPAERLLVVFDGNRTAPAAARTQLEALGARVERDLLDAGLALITVDDAAAIDDIAAMDGVAGVSRDRRRVPQGAGGLLAIPTGILSATDVTGEPAAASRGFADPTLAPTSAPLVTPQQLLETPFFPFQWDLRRIDAPGAWATGATGIPEVKVAILGSGLDYTHPELEGRVDLDLSRSFVPEDDARVEALFPGAHPIADLGIHGSYTASIVACNAFGQSCTAPNVTLVGIKVQDFDETMRVGDLVAGIVYAGSIGADVALMPDRFYLDWRNPEDRVDILAMKLAVLYAKIRGTLLIGASWFTTRGELGINADEDPLAVQMPAQGGMTVVASTGPDDQWSGIADYGFTMVDIAAPGGYVDPETVQPPPNEFVFSVGICSSFTQFTRLADFPSMCNKEQPPQYIFSFGSRPAASHAAAVAALIASRYGGHRHGFFLRQKLLETADDIGDPGVDPFFGKGRVNAARAVTE